MTLIGLLIAIIVIAVVLYGVSILLSMIEIDARLKQLVWLVIFVVILILILGWITGNGSIDLGLNQNQRVR